ncbi:hypothetical protein CLV70_114142 [Pseudosporangium ferrugineum]|uniref:Uncharacterized protein n=1 Tax=Pseudosporangium ferrugineum TaxID=439699 RepID=A0A2T0RS32_9ACTN|nr:hypothetical protein CLV70_114142 [Pseudosporangium ferrugineum]
MAQLRRATTCPGKRAAHQARGVTGAGPLRTGAGRHARHNGRNAARAWRHARGNGRAGYGRARGARGYGQARGATGKRAGLRASARRYGQARGATGERAAGRHTARHLRRCRRPAGSHPSSPARLRQGAAAGRAAAAPGAMRWARAGEGAATVHNPPWLRDRARSVRSAGWVRDRVGTAGAGRVSRNWLWPYGKKENPPDTPELGLVFGSTLSYRSACASDHVFGSGGASLLIGGVVHAGGMAGCRYVWFRVR